MILIISSVSDQSTSDVIQWLLNYKVDFIRINYEDIVSQSIYIDINSDCIILERGYKKLSFEDIECVWYRRGDFVFSSSDLDSWDVFQNDMKNVIALENRTVINYLHYKLSSKRHLNSRLRNSVNKLYVLEQAKSVGLSIPKTLVTNHKSDLLNFYASTNKRIITKPIHEIPLLIDEADGQARVYTELLIESVISNLQLKFDVSLFQELIPKVFELRVFYIDGECYSMAIFSQQSEQTKIDFRKYDPVKPNRCTPYKLPAEIENKIDRLMRRIKINSGSIDMIYSPNGQYYFLEVNPIGQFGMTSFPCNYPIEKRIAQYLIGPS